MSAERESKDGDLAAIANGLAPVSCFHGITRSCVSTLSDFGLILDFRSADHRITLSALAKTLGGIVRPMCLASAKLIISSNLAGRSIGISAGLPPLRILCTYSPARLS